MKDRFKSMANMGKEFGGGIGKRNLTVFATSGCYYMFMSLVPSVMILVSLLRFTPFDLNMVLAYINKYAVAQLAVILRNIANSVYASIMVGGSGSSTITISVLLALFSASASMKALMKGMNCAYDFENNDNFIVFNIRALIYMVILFGTILMSLVIMVYGGNILALLEKYLSYAGPLQSLLSQSRYLLVMLVLFVVFLILYKIMPSGKVSLVAQLPGAIFSAVTWVIFSSVFTMYISVSNKFGAYGFIGTIMVAMMWIFYCLLFLLIGGYMNSFLAKKRAAGMIGSVKESEDVFDAEFDEDLADNYDSIPAVHSDGNHNSDLNRASDHKANPDFENEYTAPVSTGAVNTVSSGLVAEDSESDLDSDADSSSRKKPPIPILAAATACALAAFGAVFFFLFRKKKGAAPKKKKSMLKKAAVGYGLVSKFVFAEKADKKKKKS